VRVTRPRSLQFALAVAAFAWVLCARAVSARAAHGLALRFDQTDLQPLLESAFLLFLTVIGFALLRAIERRKMPLSMSLGLPQRKTRGKEWLTGAAIGWGLAVASVLPMALARALNARLWTAPRAFELLAIALATLAVATLAHAVGVYGYGFQRLIEAIGPVRATVAMMLLAAVYAGFDSGTSRAAILASAFLSLLLCLCWLRTHGLWLLWGLQFAWSAVIAVLFGLPLAGNSALSSVVDTRTIGPWWLTGGDYGPAAALLSILLLLVAIPVLVKATDDYAWDYTRPPIIPAGYDVTVPPPAAHAAMEAAAAQKPGTVHPASLVQILPAPPPPPPRPTE
jgi:hypothetical protein